MFGLKCIWGAIASIRRVLGSTWCDIVVVVRYRRAVWVREIQPGLVKADQSLAAAYMRVGLCLVYGYLLLRWYPHKYGLKLILYNVFMISVCIIRCYCSRQCTVGYARWRWLMYLCRAWVFVVVAPMYHILATPSHNVFGYLKNLLAASGIMMSFMMPFFDTEMFPLSFAYITVQSVGLSYNAEKVCQQGLLATEYSASMTRSLFVQLGRVIHVMASMYRTDNDPLLAAPAPPDPSQNLPCCLCVMQTLLITFCFILPNTLLYLQESYILDRAALRRARGHEHEGQPFQHANRDLQVQWALFASGFIRVTGFTLLGGSLVWAAMRYYYEV